MNRTAVRSIIAALSAVGALQAVASEPRGLPVCGIPSSMGVNIHFTDPRPGEMEMLAGSGVKWIRMDFTWGGIEREKGVYDFSRYDRLLAALQPHGIRALFILDYANRLYDGGLAPHTDEGRAAFARFAAAAAKHFAGHGILWEMWNEPNLDGFWKPKADVQQYIPLARAVGEALRKEAPGELYIGPGVSRIDLPFLQACFEAGLLDLWSAVSVHPYRQTGPESAAAEYAALRRLIARHAPAGKAIPILSGEWGYSAAWNRYDEDRQGLMTPREFLVNLVSGVPLSIWYDWHDDGRDPKEPEHHFGLVANAYHEGRTPVYDPKPAYRAAQTLARELGGFDFRRRIPVCRTGPSPMPGVPGPCSADDWVLLFTRGDEQRLVAWTASSEPRKVRIFTEPGAFRVVRHTGESAPGLTATDAGLELEIDGAPRYLRPEKHDALLAFVADSPAPTLDYRPSARAHSPVVRFDPDAPTAELLPSAATALVARVRHHGGAAAPFRIRAIAGGRVVAESAVTPPAGAEETVVRLVPPSTIEDATGIRLVLHDASGAVCSIGESERQVLIRDFAPEDASAFRVAADGDKAVGSTQTLASAKADASLPPGATGALAMTYRMEAGWKFIRLVPTPSQRAIAGRPAALGIWICGDGEPLHVTLRVIDEKGQTFQPPSAPIERKGWQFVRLRMDGTDTGHWGGPGDGVMHGALKWDSLAVVDKKRDRVAAGRMLFALPTLFYAADAQSR